MIEALQVTVANTECCQGCVIWVHVIFGLSRCLSRLFRMCTHALLLCPVPGVHGGHADKQQCKWQHMFAKP